jgi:SAM-dependent methyltransferase
MSDKRELFKDTAWYYSRYRFGYPQEFFEYIAKLFDLDSQSRVLDLGCGTGQISIPLAKKAGEVIAVDSEQDMLEEAKKQAEKAGVQNIEWILDKAENINEDLGSFTLATMGASFHWMDQELVLEKVCELLEQGGGLVLVSDHGLSPWKEPEDDWQEVRTKVLKKYLGEKRRAGTGLHKPSQKRFEDLLEESPFGGYQEWTYAYKRTQNLEEAVNYMYSTSFAQKRFFGDRIDEYEKELQKELLKVEPSGTFSQQVEVQALVARK